MNESNREGRSSISGAGTVEEIGEFWDSHSLADYAEETAEVSFELRARRRCRITLDPELYTRLETEALTRGVSPETLVIDSRTIEPTDEEKSMSIRLNYAVVHELVKEAGTPEARVDLAETSLSAENRVVVDLVSQIVGLIGQRENMAHYGVFRDDPASTRVPSVVKGYCTEAEPTPDGFLALTKDCMIALHDRARSQNLATGGYLLFADYVSTDRFLLVAMIKQRSGITMEGLVPTNITELDLRKLHQVARVAFDRLCRYEEAAAERQDMTYVTFVSPKGSRQAAGYFVTALGCKPGTPAAAATKAAVVGTRSFFDAREPIRSRGYEARVELIEFLRRKADNKERVNLHEVVEVVRRCFPLEEAERLSEEFAAHLQSETLRVPAEFPVSKATVNRYTRFKYQSSQLKVEIDKAAVTREDSGPIYFDEAHGKLVISEEDFITKLSTALQDDE